LRATGLSTPLSVVTVYYAAMSALGWAFDRTFPQLHGMLPIGAIDSVIKEGVNPDVETMFSSVRSQAVDNVGTLALAMSAALVLMIPVSWVYLLTHDRKDIEAPFVQTILVLPIVVAGIAMIVQNSLALAFSLAGIVAAVRFRFALDTPAQALFIFAAIAVGLAAGISALEVAVIVSVFFVYITMILWKLDYGEHLGGRFLRLFTGRREDD